MLYHDDCYGNLIMFHGFSPVVACSDEFGQYAYIPDLELLNWLREELDKLSDEIILARSPQLRDDTEK